MSSPQRATNFSPPCVTTNERLVSPPFRGASSTGLRQQARLATFFSSSVILPSASRRSRLPIISCRGRARYVATRYCLPRHTGEVPPLGAEGEGHSRDAS